MRFSAIAVIFGIAAIFCLACRVHAVEFAPPTAYSVGTNPSGVVVADFNGDGKLDLAVVNSGSNNVSILLGNGDGSFQPAKNFDVGNSMTSIFAGDFNGDGKMDLAVFLPGNSSASTNGEVRILLGNGDGTFQSPVTTTLTVAATVLRVEDFNGDKIADLVLSNVDPVMQVVTLELFLGKGDGTFQSAKQIAASGLSGAKFAVADFNNDSKLDLAISVAGGVQILFGQGNGTFQPGATAVVADGFSVADCITADLNGDGRVDLIAVSLQGRGVGGPTGTTSTTQHVSVFLALSGGTFGSEQILFTGSSSSGEFGTTKANLIGALQTGDFNGDGNSDLLDFHQEGPFHFSPSAFELRLGKADGTLAPVIVLDGLSNPFLVHDLNGDKLDDIVVIEASANQIAVFINTSPASGADLGIINGTASGKAGQGLTLSYSADVLNEGPEGATNVTFTDVLPSGVTFVSAVSSQGTCAQSNLKVTCNLGSLGDVADVQITIVVTPTVTGTITNTMSISATEPDLAMANNSASQTTDVVSAFTLTVTKAGNGSGEVTQVLANPPNPDNATINCGTTCSGKFLAGTTVTLGAGSDPGDFFTGWTGACSSSNSSCQVTISADTSVTANFVKGAVLTVTLAGAGVGVVQDVNAAIFICTSSNGDCSPSLLPGTTISIQAIPSGNSTFAGWSGACTGTDPNTCTITMSANESVAATFNPPPDFTVAPAQASLTVKGGSKVSEVLSFSAQGGFSAAIALSCSVIGAAPTPTCSISPNSVNPGSNAMLSVDASGLSAMSFHYVPRRMPSVYALSLALAALAFLLTATLDQQRRHAWLLTATVLVLSVFPTACGGGSSAPPSPKNYTVTITATSGAIQHSTTIALTVN